MNTINVIPISNKQQRMPITLAKGAGIDDVKENLDLKAIKNLMGKLWIPVYLTTGYSLYKTIAISGRSLNLIFKNTSSNSILRIKESPRPANLHILMNKYHSVPIRGQNGFLVNGCWSGSLENPSESTWQESHCLWLVFNIEDWILTLEGTPAKAWSEEELIKIAESMKEYEG